MRVEGVRFGLGVPAAVALAGAGGTHAAAEEVFELEQVMQACVNVVEDDSFAPMIAYLEDRLPSGSAISFDEQQFSVRIAVLYGEVDVRARTFDELPPEFDTTCAIDNLWISGSFGFAEAEQSVVRFFGPETSVNGLSAIVGQCMDDEPSLILKAFNVAEEGSDAINAFYFAAGFMAPSECEAFMGRFGSDDQGGGI